MLKNRFPILFAAIIFAGNAQAGLLDGLLSALTLSGDLPSSQKEVVDQIISSVKIDPGKQVIIDREKLLSFNEESDKYLWSLITQYHPADIQKPLSEALKSMPPAPKLRLGVGKGNWADFVEARRYGFQKDGNIPAFYKDVACYWGRGNKEAAARASMYLWLQHLSGDVFVGQPDAAAEEVIVGECSVSSKLARWKENYRRNMSALQAQIDRVGGTRGVLASDKIKFGEGIALFPSAKIYRITSCVKELSAGRPGDNQNCADLLDLKPIQEAAAERGWCRVGAPGCSEVAKVDAKEPAPFKPTGTFDERIAQLAEHEAAEKAKSREKVAAAAPAKKTALTFAGDLQNYWTSRIGPVEPEISDYIFSVYGPMLAGELSGLDAEMIDQKMQAAQRWCSQKIGSFESRANPRDGSSMGEQWQMEMRAGGKEIIGQMHREACNSLQFSLAMSILQSSKNRPAKGQINTTSGKSLRSK